MRREEGHHGNDMHQYRHHHHHQRQHHNHHHNQQHHQPHHVPQKNTARFSTESKDAAPAGASSPPPQIKPTPTVQADAASVPVPNTDMAPLREEEKVNITEMEVVNPLPVVRASCFHPESPLLFTGDSDGVLHILDTKNEKPDTCMIQCAGIINEILCTKEHVIVACATLSLYSFADIEKEMAAALADAPQEDKDAKSKDGMSPKHTLDVQPLFSSSLPDKDSIAVSLRVHGDEVAVGDSAGQVWKYRVEGAEGAPSLALCEGPYALHRTNVTGLVFDDTRMITASHDGTVLFTTIKVRIFILTGVVCTFVPLSAFCYYLKSNPQGDDMSCTQITPCLLEQVGERGKKRTVTGQVKPSAGIIACGMCTSPPSCLLPPFCNTTPFSRELH